MKRVSVLVVCVAACCMAVWLAAGIGKTNSWQPLSERQLRGVRGGCTSCYYMQWYVCSGTFETCQDGDCQGMPLGKSPPDIYVCLKPDAWYKGADGWAEHVSATSPFHDYIEETSIDCYDKYDCDDQYCEEPPSGPPLCVQGAWLDYRDLHTHELGLNPGCSSGG